MDDLFLYNHIKQAIKERKKFQKNTESNNFAENYCRRELMKKKINFDSTSHQSAAIKKMKLLMKDFQHVDTYIDLNQLLYSINTIKAKQQAENKLKQAHQKQRISRVSRLNKINHQSQHLLSRFHVQKENQPILDPIQVLKDKFKGQINEMIKRKYQSQNSQMDFLVNHLQNDTNLYNSLLKNNSTSYLSYLNNQLQKIKKQEDPASKNSQENQKIFKYLTQNLSQSKQPKKQRPYFKSTNLNSKHKKQENQLLHKISTFLQIALENQHKQKWATKQIKKFRSTHGSFRFNKGKQERSKFFLQDIQMEKESSSIFQNQISQKKRTKSKNTLTKKNTFFLTKVDYQKRSTFGHNSLQKSEASSNKIEKISRNLSKIRNSNKEEDQKNTNHQSLFKFFQNGTEKERKTVPVKRQNLNSSFDNELRVGDKESQNFIRKNSTNIKTLKVTENGLNQNKKDYLINKGRKNREYNFISPSRQNVHYKTVIVKSNQQSSIKKQQTDQNDSIIQIYPPQSQIQSFQNESQSETMNLTPVTSFLRASKSNLSLNKKKMSKKSMISQNFTFKKRSKKQQILKKLNSFIEGITNQQKISKQQNQYYDSAINHLQDLSKTTYKNYEPQALAGMEEISQLKKFVNSINPSLRKNHSKNSIGKRSP